MKKIGINILFIFFILTANAQQVTMCSHYFYKPMVYNPAFTGYEDAANAMLISRAQWTGFKGSPQLHLFTLDGNLISKKVGLGLSLISDRKGLTSRIGGSLGYSYRLNINDDAYLRFGISLGIIDQTIDFSKAIVENSSDPALFSDAQRKTIIDGNAGLALVWKQLEFGFSVPQLFGNRIAYVDNTNVRSKYTEVRHYLSSLKYKFFISEEKKISLSPMALVRFIPNAPLQYEGNIDLGWKEKFWIGAAYKSNYAIGLHAGVCIHNQLYVGYAYEFITGSIGSYSGMSHEVMVNFKFGRIKKEEKVLENTENNIKENQKLDSLQTELQESQIKIKENEGKLKDLNDKLEQLKIQQTAIIQTQADNSSLENKNDNQNSAVLSGSINKVNENGVWIVTGNVKDFKDAGNNISKKGFYVIAGTFVYRDFAQSEAKRLNSAGYKQSSYLFFEPKQYNYVFILKAESKEEAVKSANQAKASGIKDAWVQQLTE